MALLVATTIAFASISSTAVAGDPDSAQYCNGLSPTSSNSLNCGSVAGNRTGGASGQEPVSKAVGGLKSQVGSLPFTGWDLMSLGAIALMLTASGLVLARLTSGRRPPA